MAYVVQDPQALLDRRHELELARTIVNDTLHSVAQSVGELRWQGNTANRVKSSLVADTNDLIHILGDLDAAIHAIENHRGWCFAQRDELKKYENRIIRWISHFNSLPAEQQATIPVKPGNLNPLPAPFSTRWRELAAILRRNRVAF